MVLGDRIRGRIELVQGLLRRFDLSIDYFLARYPMIEFYRRLLDLAPGWSPEDQKELERRSRGTEYHRDLRTTRDYAANLLLGWVVEDLVVLLLERKGFRVKLVGTDARRELLPGALVSETPQLEVYGRREIWHLDVVTDYPTGRRLSYWKKTGKCDLRDSKFRRLIETTRPGHKAGIIGVVVGSGEYFALEITAQTHATYIGSHRAYGGKPARQVDLRALGVPFYPLEELPKGLPIA